MQLKTGFPPVTKWEIESRYHAECNVAHVSSDRGFTLGLTTLDAALELVNCMAKPGDTLKINFEGTFE